MVSYYNPLPYSQKHGANLPYPAQSWFSSNYHHPPNHQYLGDVEAGAHGHNVYYSPHMFPQSSPDWVAHENFQTAQQASLLQQSQHASASGGLGGGGGSGNSSAGGGGGGSSGSGSTPTTVHLHPHHHPGNPEHFTEGLPSPPITVSGSEMSSPGGANGAPSPQNSAGNRATPGKSPYYDWMKKPSYVTQPNPGKTRTKDKYRVVYTDFQRLELEKEYHTSRYITIRRKTELAQTLQLSERQVKIWFQNRRAKERKQTKKREDPLSSGLGQHSSPGSIVSMLDNKPKLDGSSLHLQHPLHQMSSMAMGMPPMSLHHPVLHHIGAPPPPPQHLHHPHSQVSTPTSAGPVSM